MLRNAQATKKINPVITYKDAALLKQDILADNKGLSGIYQWVNRLNKKTYIGSGKNLSKRLAIYFSKNSLIKQKRSIHNALLKYGHENFTLEILEYCQENELMKREQYYLDLYNPKYNILKFAYSPLGKIVGKKTRAKLSLAIRQYRKNNPWSVKDLMKFKARAIHNKGIPVTILNIFTNERWNFNSITEGSDFLGIHHNNLQYALKAGSLINKTYLVSKNEGNLDSSSKAEALTKLHAEAMESLVTVLNLKTNETIRFGNQHLAGEFLGITDTSVSQAIKKGRKVKGIYLINRGGSSGLGPTKLLENKLKVGRVGIPVKILNLKTSEILEFTSQIAAGKFLGLADKTLIQSIQDRNTVKGIYIISKKGAQPWTGEELVKLRAKAIKREIIVSNIETNETLEFSSPDAVGEFLKMTGGGVRHAIKKGSKVKGIYRITNKEAPTLTNEDVVNIERMLKF